MATVLEFVMGSEGDTSVGIQSCLEKVSVIFHGPSEIREDEAKELCKIFADFADGWCIPREEWEENNAKNRVTETLGYEDWKKEQREVTTTYPYDPTTGKRLMRSDFPVNPIQPMTQEEVNNQCDMVAEHLRREREGV